MRDAASLAAALAALQAKPAWTVVALDYELGYLLEPKAAPPGWQVGSQVLARFWRFTERVEMSTQAADVWLQQAAGDVPAGVGGLQAAIDEAAYATAIARIKALIFAGDCYQVNFTFPLQFTWFGQPAALYARLRQRQPVRYGGFIGNTDAAQVSLSPELFLERRGNRLVTRPMKGTAPRSVVPERLLNSAKDRAENLMIVDLLRNDLGRVADNGSVKVDRLFDIEAYPTVWQMVSEVSANIAPQVSFSDVLRALFPCGSITGAPKIRAMQIAAELETQPRGLYTGALGWLAPNGDFRLNVAIRTLDLQAGGGGRLGIGSGIVADSDGAAEWAECHLKARFLSEDDSGIQLIETLRCENGAYPRLALHLARLRHSAAWLGFTFDEPKIRAALADVSPAGQWRVRLTLAKDGACEVTAFPLPDEPAGPRHAVLAASPIDSRYPLRRHKTTDRAQYDAALKAIAADPAIFDQVFLNERGEVAEGARSNVFVERDGLLLTPPISSGALPGVLRAELLAEGRASESVLLPDDLAGGFWLGNALRGLVWVRLRQA